MELRPVEVPHRTRGAAAIMDDDVEKAVREIKAGRATTRDELSFRTRREAQTEAWRWRHELARRSDLEVSDLKSSTFGADGAGYRFMIYSWRHFASPGTATAAAG